MTLFDQLRTYLNTPNANYNKGVELLFRINKRNGLRESLLLHPNIAKLQRHLDEAYTELSSDNSVLTPPQIHPLVSTTPPLSELGEIEDRRIQLFKELSHYHTLMGDLPKDTQYDSQRYEYMQKCVLIDNQLFELRNDVAFYKRTGNLPQRKVITRDLTEGQAQTKLQYESARRSRLYHTKCIEKYQSALVASEFMDDIVRITEKLEKHRTKLHEVELEVKRLEVLLTDTSE